jgi:hypothetical protein
LQFAARETVVFRAPPVAEKITVQVDFAFT